MALRLFFFGGLNLRDLAEAEMSRGNVETQEMKLCSHSDSSEKVMSSSYRLYENSFLKLYMKKKKPTERFDFRDRADGAIRVKMSPIQQRSIFNFTFIFFSRLNSKDKGRAGMALRGVSFWTVYHLELVSIDLTGIQHLWILSLSLYVMVVRDATILYSKSERDNVPGNDLLTHRDKQLLSCDVEVQIHKVNSTKSLAIS